jgi:DNA-binding MarR family transcriptional regulator
MAGRGESRGDRARGAAARIAGACLAMRVRRLSRSVTRVFDEALRPHGIGTAQLNVLVAIAASGPMRPSEVARALDLEKSTVTRDLERMIASGWVRARPGASPGRYVVEVRPAGLALLERVLPAWQAAQRRATRQVGSALAAAVRSAARARS